MHRRRMSWKLSIAMVLAILFVVVATTRLEQSRMAASIAGASAAMEGASHLSADRLLQDVQALSSPGLEGRLTGSPGSHKAQQLILRRFREIGLEPIVPRTGGPGTSRRSRSPITASRAW